MKLFFDDTQLAHQPQQFMIAGRIVASFEVPDRARRMAEGLATIGLTLEAPADFGRTVIDQVHCSHYVDFLTSAYDQFMALPNCGPEVLASVFPYAGVGADLAPRPAARPQSIVGRAGWYMGGMSVTIGEGTWRASYASAQAAIAAAATVRDGAMEAMALCRPPGHHAAADRAAGFCYLNNAALAAEVLRTRFDKVAILDFDTHHGDGTQAIFYRRSDVFYGSVHTDPAVYYPFFIGYADETGFGAGEGANLNIPLPARSRDDAFIDANRELIVRALAAGAQALVISAGWDAHRDDPLSLLDVGTEAFAVLGDLYGEIPLPTVIVQEGGYSLSAIADIAPAFVRSFMNERKFG